jgi:hypothetical protein
MTNVIADRNTRVACTLKSQTLVGAYRLNAAEAKGSHVGSRFSTDHSACALVASACESTGDDDEYPDPPRQAY